MKHNTLLLLIFVPILVYQLYHTFRYWKEGLEESPKGDDMPDFCKGKDGLDGEKWEKKTKESKCKWEGIPEDDENHCISKQRDWCEKDCKGKFDHKSGGEWCTDIGKGGKDADNAPTSGTPFCDESFLETLNKKCPVDRGADCKCWEEIKFNKAVCKLPEGISDMLGGPTGQSVYKMHCGKGYNKSEFMQMVMGDGTTAEDAEISWNALSHNGTFNMESIKNYILKVMAEASRKERDTAERKESGIGPKPTEPKPKPYTFLFDGCPRGSAASKWKMVQGTTNFDKCTKLCSDDPKCNAIEINGCGTTKGDLSSKCNKNCYHFYGDGTDFKNGGCVTDGNQKAYRKNPKSKEPEPQKKPHSGWYLGKPRESCTDVCKKLNKPCNDKRIAAVSSSDEVRKVAKMLGLECDGKKGDGTAEAHQEGKGSAAPFKNTEDKGPWKNTCRYVKKTGDCNAAYHLYSRFCPCGDDPGLSGKAAAISNKTRKQALASGKPLPEADADAKAAAAQVIEGTSEKGKVEEIIRNIAGGGGSLAAQAIGSHLAKMNAEKESAEKAMAEIPNKDKPAKGDVSSGSLASSPIQVGDISKRVLDPPRTRGESPQDSDPLGSNEKFRFSKTPDKRISWPSGGTKEYKENSNCAAFCGYKTPFCQDKVKGSKKCQTAIRVDTKKGCEDFSRDMGDICKWQTKEFRPCTKQCWMWGCSNCKTKPTPQPPSGGNSQECTMCRLRGSNSVYCRKCRETCQKEGKVWNGRYCAAKMGGCEGTEFGCCPDGKTAKKDLTGFNCHGPPSGKPIEGRFKAWIDNGGKSSFEANTIVPPSSTTSSAQDIEKRLSAHEKHFHAENHSSKQSDLKGTSLKKVKSEVNKNGWCIPQKNKQGKILSWIAKPTNTPGWSKTDKCLTMDGKQIIFGTGSCLQGQTEDECNLGLVKLDKDKYWHTHPVLLRKVKESGPMGTPLGSKYV